MFAGKMAIHDNFSSAASPEKFGSCQFIKPMFLNQFKSCLQDFSKK
jgi:hypothetical protein